MLPANSRRITYCTGYWFVGGNAKRSPEYYERHIPRTLRMIAGCRLILFHEDDAVRSFFETHARANRVEIHGVKVPVPQLPTYRYSEQFLRNCANMKDGAYLSDAKKFKKEKGVKHYLRDYLGSGEASYREIISIWMSKIPLVAETAIEANPFNADYFAWIDASITRFKHSRSNWDFMRLRFDGGALYHFDNDTRCMGRPIGINASFLLAHRDVWRQVNALFGEQIERSLSDAYAHDEETVLNLVLQSNPHLFRLVGKNHRGYRKQMFKTWNRFAKLVGAC
jgi:hypothetical protein